MKDFGLGLEVRDKVWWFLVFIMWLWFLRRWEEIEVDVFRVRS